MTSSNVTLFQIFILFTLGNLTAQENSFILKEELLFPLQSKHVHASAIVSLPNGDLLAAWFEGSGERRADDVLIRGARRSRGSTSWSSPFDLADTPDLPDCNPVLFLNQEKKLFLVWIAVQANKWENSILRVRTSTEYLNQGAPRWEWQDNILLKPDEEFALEVATKLDQLPELGRGWAEYALPYDRQIKLASENPTFRSLGWMTRIPPLVLPEGRILLPLYSDGLNLSLVAISDDQGQTWQPSNPIVGRGPIQPSLILEKNGRITAFMRDSGDAPSRVQISHSEDNGKSWSPATKSDIPNTASVTSLRLDDGRWALAGNMIDDGRYQLMLWLSNDEGQTWSKKKILENDKQKTGRFSYPCLIQSGDHHLHLTYSFQPAEGQKSIKYLEIDPTKL
ncbi:MAG: exo-alpha-sialidase [Saprospiraceae bacterium]|nr:exo-alpha-sialidase [Saprospiraceae bacterium]